MGARHTFDRSDPTSSYICLDGKMKCITFKNNKVDGTYFDLTYNFTSHRLVFGGENFLFNDVKSSFVKLGHISGLHDAFHFSDRFGGLESYESLHCVDKTVLIKSDEQGKDFQTISSTDSIFIDGNLVLNNAVVPDVGSVYVGRVVSKIHEHDVVLKLIPLEVSQSRVTILYSTIDILEGEVFPWSLFFIALLLLTVVVLALFLRKIIKKDNQKKQRAFLVSKARSKSNIYDDVF
ncbi:hypothetical protein PCE1_003636 [Barthelona sp. PCE]